MVLPVSGHTGVGPTLGDALLQGKIENWQTAEKHTQEVEQANRLTQNFSLPEEYSRVGRLLSRERLDGTREKITYDQNGRLISVWVTSPDGKFEKERLYVDNYLRAILYVDKSLKTLQYLGPLQLGIESKEQKSEADPALCIIVSAGAKVRILQYNTYGKLLGSYQPNGKKNIQTTQTNANDLDQVIPINELQFLKQ